MNIKHSKFRNTGILFELLVRQITIDTLEGKNSKAAGLLKKYFVKTELGKEYKLYETLLKNKNLSEGKADLIINTILESSINLNKSSLRRLKYNLIKEIKEEYNVDEFFRYKLPNYKQQAALCNLIETYSNPENNKDAQYIIENKLTLLEYISSKPVSNKTEKLEILEEFEKEDKSTRILTQRLLMDKFNEKYSKFHPKQKEILREYINSVNNSSKLKNFYNNKVVEVLKELKQLNAKIEDENTQIKIHEILGLIKEIDKNQNVKDKDILNLLQYYSLIEEIKKVHG